MNFDFNYLEQHYGYIPETGEFWCKNGNSTSSLDTGYRTVKYKEHTVLVHQIIWCLVMRQNVPEGLTIDHIDRDKRNNKWTNLRLLSFVGQQLNRAYKAGSTGYRGVTFQKDRNNYQATIRFNGKRLNLGRFKTAKEASDAYEIKHKELEEQHLL